MITQNHNVVVVLSAQAVLTALDQACEGFGIRNANFFKLVVLEIALERYGLGYVTRQRKLQLDDAAIALAELVSDAIGVYFWQLFANILREWCVIDDIKIIGNWEIWLCLNRK
jgi:hypothetical protein